MRSRMPSPTSASGSPNSTSRRPESSSSPASSPNAPTDRPRALKLAGPVGDAMVAVLTHRRLFLAGLHARIGLRANEFVTAAIGGWGDGHRVHHQTAPRHRGVAGHLEMTSIRSS